MLIITHILAFLLGAALMGWHCFTWKRHSNFKHGIKSSYRGMVVKDGLIQEEDSNEDSI